MCKPVEPLSKKEAESSASIDAVTTVSSANALLGSDAGGTMFEYEFCTVNRTFWAAVASSSLNSTVPPL